MFNYVQKVTLSLLSPGSESGRTIKLLHLTLLFATVSAVGTVEIPLPI